MAMHAQDTPADNWSQFRGNHRLTGVSASTVPNELKLLWTYEAGESIESSAAIVGGTVFVGSQKGELISLNLDNGAVFWKYHVDSPIGESSPAYSDGVVYIGDLGGWFHAVNATNGKKLWTRTIGSTVVGEACDTVVFYPLAFYGTWSNNMLLSVMMANYVIKVGWEVLATPITYRVVKAIKLAENEDYFDRKTNFTPFSLKVDTQGR